MRGEVNATFDVVHNSEKVKERLDHLEKVKGAGQQNITEIDSSYDDL